YKLHWDTDAPGYPFANVMDLGNVTSHTLTGLTQGTTYYLAISAYDSEGNESWFSNGATGSTSSPTPTPNATFTLSPTPAPTATASTTPTPTPAPTATASTTPTPSPVAGPSLTGWGLTATAVALGFILMIVVSRRVAANKPS
ncbi:MAG: hypothetical protein HY663_06420, partial [Chloroflexi bacterium]|nr:hypothetical protein [Chloroflexota bacterium]